MDGIVGGEFILSPAGSSRSLSGMRCSSEDGEAAGATAKPHHPLYYGVREASRSLLDRWMTNLM